MIRKAGKISPYHPPFTQNCLNTLYCIQKQTACHSPGSPPCWENQLCINECYLGKMGVGNWYGRRKRRAELSIYLPFRSVFWRIVFDWLPSDTKRVLNREMHQDFSVNARVPPKSASERLENTSSAASWRSPCQFPTPIFPYTTYHLQSVPFSAKPKFICITSYRDSNIIIRNYYPIGTIRPKMFLHSNKKVPRHNTGSGTILVIHERERYNDIRPTLKVPNCSQRLSAPYLVSLSA